MLHAYLILAAHELFFVVRDVYRLFYKFAPGVYESGTYWLCCVKQRVVDWIVVRDSVRAHIDKNEGTILTLEVRNRRETRNNRCFGIAVVIERAGCIQ